MKKADTIALYREAFLEGKDEIDRRRFDEKDETRQYNVIMSWKRRQGLTAKREETSVASLIESIRKIDKIIPNLPELSEKEAAKIKSAAQSIIGNVDNFDQIKKARRLRELKSQRSSLEREIELLESQGVKEC